MDSERFRDFWRLDEVGRDPFLGETEATTNEKEPSTLLGPEDAVPGLNMYILPLES